MPKFTVTTSWDDGAVEDLKILGLLKKYGLRGTFYIPKNIDFEIKPGKKLWRVSDNDICEIAREQEVGAHSLSHKYFNELDERRAREEIFGSKKYLEELLSKEVKMFCYPGGEVSGAAVKIVQEAGFVGARVTEVFNFDIASPFLMGTTIHCYPFPFRKDVFGKLFFYPFRKNYRDIIKLRLPLDSFLGWPCLARNLFDYAVRNGKIFHLWGHSWEIEKYNMWGDLEEVFKYVSGRPDIEYLTNAEVIKTLPK